MGLLGYLQHYLQPHYVLLMLITAIGCIFVCIGLIRLFTARSTPKERQGITEQFYELIFSATTILLFVGTYFLIDFLGYGDQNPFWVEYSDFILLGFIFGSIILNSFLDNFIIPLKTMKPGARSTMRLLGMLYMLIVFAYIKFIYQNDNYDNIIFYFLTLVIGRFVYFDASIEGFTEAISDALRALPLLALSLICSGVIAYVGFSTGYLLRTNGVVFNLFLGHLFLLLVIFVVHWLAMFVNFVTPGRKKTKQTKQKKAKTQKRVYPDDDPEEDYRREPRPQPVSRQASYTYGYKEEADYRRRYDRGYAGSSTETSYGRDQGRYADEYDDRFVDEYDERYTEDYDPLD